MLRPRKSKEEGKKKGNVALKKKKNGNVAHKRKKKATRQR